MVAATLGRNLGPPMPKWSNDSYLQEKQELETTCTLSITCQTNVGATCSSYLTRLEDIGRHAT